MVRAMWLGLAVLVGPVVDDSKDLARQEKELLELTNQERQKTDAKTLRWNDVLAGVARAHAKNMAKQQKPVHELDGKTPYDRIKAAGYLYYRAGENVGATTSCIAIEDLMKAWMDSKGHRENILQVEFTEAGMGAWRGEDDMIYFAQVFGRPRKKNPILP